MEAIFIGSSDAGRVVLEELLGNRDMQINLVVSRPDRKAGRGKLPTPTPVSGYARSKAIPLITPNSWRDGAALRAVSEVRSQVIIVAAYGLLLPAELLSIPTYGVLNIHPSLLPVYRGPSPVVTALLDGVSLTGVSVMELDQGFDTGPIVSQKEVRIEKAESAESLERRLFGIGAKELLEVLPGWASGELSSRKQDEEAASYTKRFNKSDGQIDCNKTTQAIINQIRAFTPWPSSYVVWEGKTVKILEARARLSEETMASGIAPGTAMVYQAEGSNFPALKTLNGILVLVRVQMEGRTPVDGQDFLNGYPSFIGSHL